jgi:hypothetical protein
MSRNVLSVAKALAVILKSLVVRQMEEVLSIKTQTGVTMGQ